MSLYADVAFTGTTKLSQEELNRRMKILTDAIETLRLFSPDWQAQVNALVAVGLERIDDALLPIYERIKEIAHLGTIFSTTSASIETFGLGVKRFVVPEQHRPNFAPSRFLLIMVEGGSFDAVMIGRLSSYDREAGELSVLVEDSTGEGTHNSWIIGPYATNDGLEELRADVQAARAATIAAKNDATAQAAIATERAASASLQATNAAVSAGMATTKATEAKGQAERAEAAAAALSGLVSDVLGRVAATPTIDLDFTQADGFSGFTRETVVNNSGGFRRAPNGSLVALGATEPAIDFHPVTGAALGLGMWPTTANAFAGPWDLTGVTMATSGTVVAPDGSLAASAVTHQAVAGKHRISKEINLVGAGVYAMSFFMRLPNSAPYLYLLSVEDKLTGEAMVLELDLRGEGAIYEFMGGIMQSGASWSITRHAGGWYRIEVSGPPALSGGATIFRIHEEDATDEFVGNPVVGGFYLWGVQITPGVERLPIYTSAGRQIDQMVVPTSDLVAVAQSTTEATVFVEYILPRILPPRSHTVVSLAGSTEFLSLGHIGNRVAVLASAGWGIDFGAGNALDVVVPGQVMKAAFAFGNSRAAYAVNGRDARVDPLTSWRHHTSIVVGNRFNGDPDHVLHGSVRRLVVFPVALGDADLKRMTA
ncbi:phage head spike fiber domain-containing protein [Mycoplana rhizolycopersici]|uniref:Minor tail protein n=1 Tax=Mycoplana rhizolycopersici TaxID=2746702 RepID=A0ABX2QE99_9HYPH|nr:hypothetical protein [Rhizobium rhizolycopersici]NVP56094.1 hypothetical protein [Rhizobium rhizolycopersici]